MKLYKTLVIASLALLSVAACKKREESKPTDTNTAGKGGNATVKLTPKHHTKFIDSCTIYVKYNTLDKPSASFSPSQYDDKIECVKMGDGSAIGTFTGLKKGKYFFYGVGWDKNGPYAVEGGLPVTITEDITYSQVLAVTEGD